MALKAGRVGVNPNYVDKEGRPLYDNSYLKELLRKEGIITLFTKEGNPISIDNAVKGHLYSCTVTLSPKQAGTGTPAPDNVRAISGYDTLKITANSVDTDYSFDNTVYGGVLDVSSGVLSITHKIGQLPSTGWTRPAGWAAGTYSQNLVFTDIKPVEGYASTAPLLCNIAKTDTPTNIANGIMGIGLGVGNNLTIFVNFGDTYDDTDKLATFLSDNPCYVCYELATPVTVSLTPAQIALVTGSNTVTSTTGTSLDIQYLGTLVPGGANGRSLNRSLNLNRGEIDSEARKEIQDEIKEEVKEVPVEEPVTVKKSTKKSTK